MNRERALALRLEGASYAQIGKALGISRQRAQQLVSPPPAIRSAVVKKARGRCAGCGLGVGSSGHVHHKEAVGVEPDRYNDLQNLTLLCPSCHAKAHAGGNGRAPVTAWVTNILLAHVRGHLNCRCGMCAVLGVKRDREKVIARLEKRMANA